MCDWCSHEPNKLCNGSDENGSDLIVRPTNLFFFTLLPSPSTVLVLRLGDGDGLPLRRLYTGAQSTAMRWMEKKIGDGDGSRFAEEGCDLLSLAGDFGTSSTLQMVLSVASSAKELTVMEFVDRRWRW